ncbi:amidohydrolase family protein [Agrobacterium vitis]|uniref:amidohydrolase family protein n=1 Tax=Agrobacterium vitis TaxID=373 RepID=UPI0020364BFE|nr:amidohydrolase family protein [Agrobacterium vitis]MCM2453609.1 amidohydrolase family protein [Agrobacterium vitis]
MALTKSRFRREQLTHPVIDSDVHSVEFIPVLEDFIHVEGGTKLVEKFRLEIRNGRFQSSIWYDLSPEERHRQRCQRPPWWSMPAARTEDLAAVSLPAFLAEKMYDHGTDYSILYSNIATFAVLTNDPDLRIPLCRAVNRYQFELFSGHHKHMTSAAAIPLFTPEEGIAELEHAVGELGYKVALITGGAPRPIQALAEKYPARDHPDLAKHIVWFDTFGIDTEYDYDPFWEAATRYGVPLMVHKGTQGWNGRASNTNFAFNQVGHFAAGSEAITRSLFLSGVTRRHPDLRVGLLEGGLGYATILLSDLISSWQRRGKHVVSMLDPARIDLDALFLLYQTHAPDRVKAKLTDAEALAPFIWGVNASGQGPASAQTMLDEFAFVDPASEQEICDLFLPNFYFGVEGCDVSVSHGFNTVLNPNGAELKCFWATDAGHWDVPDLTTILDETWMHVEHGIIVESDFRKLVYENPKQFYTHGNKDFFANTALEWGA